MASATQSQKRNKGKRFIKEPKKIMRRKVTSKQCSEGEKEPVNTMWEGSEHEVSWDDGRTIVEIGMLAEGLESCCFCQQPVH